MEVIKAIKKRKSIRKYKDIPIEKDKLDIILEAGRLSHSARNSQDWKFIMVTEKELIKKVASSMKQEFGYGAKAILVCCGLKNPEYMMCGHSRCTTDISIATAYMELVAFDLGIGSCWIGSFNPDMVKEVLNIPDDMVAVSLTTLGYPDEDPEYKPRKEFSQVVSYNKF